MLDIGWSELLVVGVLALLVVGPRELPRLMRTVGQWAGKARSLAREFQRNMDDVAREADLKELTDARSMLDEVRSIKRDAERGLANPTSWAKDTVKETVKETVVGKSSETPAPALPAPPSTEAAAAPKAKVTASES